MYIPSHFEEPRIEVMHDLIQTRPLATVITLSSGGIDANHIPLHLSDTEGRLGVLRGHVARANSMRHELIQDVEALAVFHGPDSYISPSWYPAKQEHGRVIPTWNYAVVHAYGTLKIVDDPVWLMEHLQALTTKHEMAFPEPWAVSDAPGDFIEKLLENIIGIEIAITRLKGKWKASQNQSLKNQLGIINGLNGDGGSRELEMADLVMEKTGTDLFTIKSK